MRAEGRWMNAELSERDKDMDKQERRERIEIQQGVGEVPDRGHSGVPGEGECEREKKDGETQMRERGEREQVLDGRKRKTIEHIWSGCGEMRERERKERGEILREDGRQIRWMKERERIEIEKGGG
jgi:hypothetical protein